jgi:hypothetical protein
LRDPEVVGPLKHSVKITALTKGRHNAHPPEAGNPA